MSESTMTINDQGTKLWKNSKGKLHCIDGPAIERTNGDKLWYANGKLHRTDGPAAETSNGYKEWHVNGEFLGFNDKGFWALWERLTEEQKKDPVLLAYLPGDFHV